MEKSIPHFRHKLSFNAEYVVDTGATTLTLHPLIDMRGPSYCNTVNMSTRYVAGIKSAFDSITVIDPSETYIQLLIVTTSFVNYILHEEHNSASQNAVDEVKSVELLFSRKYAVL